MNIITTTGTITKITELSPTAREIEIKLARPLQFIPGSFVNIFMNIDGVKTRRAYSISSTDQEQNIISVAIRLTINGKMTPLFWNDAIIGSDIELMGPLGINTADKMQSKKKFLVGFGIGSGVIKSLLDHFSRDTKTEEIFVLLGHRSEQENLYKDDFEKMAKASNKIKIDYILSRPEKKERKKGYVQDHISEYDFSNSDIYLCGQEKACNELLEKINSAKPTNIKTFVEAFH